MDSAVFAIFDATPAQRKASNNDQGKQMKPMLNHACEIHKDFLEVINVKKQDILDGDYYALLKAPMALLYLPMCEQLGILNDNFNL